MWLSFNPSQHGSVAASSLRQSGIPGRRWQLNGTPGDRPTSNLAESRGVGCIRF